MNRSMTAARLLRTARITSMTAATTAQISRAMRIDAATAQAMNSSGVSSDSPHSAPPSSIWTISCRMCVAAASLMLSHVPNLWPQMQ